MIFTSDNGGVTSRSHNEPLRAGKGWPYEGGIRTPLLARWPGKIAAGATADTPVTSVDFFPTIAATAGVAAPPSLPVDGVDLTGVLTGVGDVSRDALFWHFPHYRGDVAPYSIVRAGNWKLIRRYAAASRDELYDLAQDPSETFNLIGSEPTRADALRARITEWIASVGGRVPTPNPDYDPAPAE